METQKFSSGAGTATTKCATCGHDSSRGNYVFPPGTYRPGDFWDAACEVCSHCRQPLKEEK